MNGNNNNNNNNISNMNELNQTMEQLFNLKRGLKQFALQTKTMRSNSSDLEEKAIQVLLQNNIRYVDEKGQGRGPFWCLRKKKSQESWSTEKYLEFFSIVCNQIYQQNAKLTPLDIMNAAQKFLKEKRKIVLEESKRCPREQGCADLIAWEQFQDNQI